MRLIVLAAVVLTLASPAAAKPGAKPARSAEDILRSAEKATEPGNDYSAYNKRGRGKLEGQAFVRLENGGAMRAAGYEVHLVPVPGEEAKVNLLNGLSGGTFPAALAEAKKLAGPLLYRTTTADADGRFTFDAVRAGAYMVASEIVWKNLRSSKVGGWRHGFVVVLPNATAKVAVSE